MSQQWPGYNSQPAQYASHGAVAPNENAWPQPQHPYRSSWQDPRLTISTAPGSHIPDAPRMTGQYAQGNYHGHQQGMPPSAGPPYQPAAHSPYAAIDTTTWGVRYHSGHHNHNTQDNDERPPLPPRPTTGYMETQHQGQYNSEIQDTAGIWPPTQQQYPPIGQPPPPSYDQVSGITYATSPPPPPPRLAPGIEGSYGSDNTASQSGPSDHIIPFERFQGPSYQNASSRPPTPPPRPAEYQSLSSQMQQPLSQFHGGPSETLQAHDSHHPPSVSHFANVGAYQSQSPPPMADYHLGAPWSDPVVPLDSPVSSPPEQHPDVSPLESIYDPTAIPIHQSQDVENDRLDSDRHEHPENLSAFHRPRRSSHEERGDTGTPGPEHVGINRTNTIDSVIQAWTKPVQPDQQIAEGTRWDLIIPAIRQLGLIAKPEDPYEDLPSESRASLERFATMLRQEAAAESGAKKLEMFSAFAQKEVRLRAVLYGLDTSPTTPSMDAGETSSPLGDDIPKNEASDQERTVQEHNLDSPPQAASVPVAPHEPGQPVSEQAHDDSYVVVDAGDDTQYSPGGRPLIERFQPRPNATDVATLNNLMQPSHEPARSAADERSKRPISPSDEAPIAVEVENPIPKDHTENITANNPAPVSKLGKSYKAFQYQSDGPTQPPEDASQAASTQSYTALRKANVDSGRAFVVPSIVMNQSYPRLAPRQEQAEAFLGLLRQRSQHEGHLYNPSPVNVTDANPPSQSEADLRAVRILIPTTVPPYVESPALTTIKKSLRTIPEDFGFIHSAVLEWNKSNLERKKILDAERRRRQEESERNIDALFNDNEIGYADIQRLEAEHHGEEAKIAADEGLEEVQTFIKDVVEIVTRRIQGQLNSLASIYAEAMTLVETHSVSGSQFVRSSSTMTALPQAMDTLLVIYSKMQIRHQKLLEASLERSRRTRKAEVNSLGAHGKATAAQEYEVKMLKAEQDIIIDAKEKDDDRANFLLDTFDKAAGRGLTENQAFVDELLPCLQTLSSNIQNGPLIYDYDTLRDVLLSSQAVLEFVSADSVSILKLCSKADEILNNADYDVSVAKAYRDDASPHEFKALEREKAKEDQNIRTETSSRIDGMVRGSMEVQSLVRDTLDKLETTPEHKQRLENALERAKKRNESLSTIH